MTNGVYLNEIRRSLIKNEISQCEKLINHLRSPSFQLEFNMGRFWFDDAINQIEKKEQTSSEDEKKDECDEKCKNE